jgi:hypothetical protein
MCCCYDRLKEIHILFYSIIFYSILFYESTPELTDSLVLGGGAQFKGILESNPPHAHIFWLLLLHTRKQFINLKFEIFWKILNLNFKRRML